MSPEAIARTIGAGSVFAVRRCVRFATSFCSWYASCSSFACQKLRRICVMSSYAEIAPNMLKMICLINSERICVVTLVSAPQSTKEIV